MSASNAVRLEKAKAHGTHYTPLELARFLARATLEHAHVGTSCSILDPACGDGSLLLAVAQAVDPKRPERLRLVGIDRDAEALEIARERLSRLGVNFELRAGDFLTSSSCETSTQSDLFRANTDNVGKERFDVVIANPPYVRTQVMGAAAAQRLATKYDLSGRVDLYHAFAKAMTGALREGGTLGLLCSNRFLSTESGASLRDLLWNAYELRWIVDLGDTKLFSAAVLPAIVIGSKGKRSSRPNCVFSRAYQVQEIEETVRGSPSPSILDSIEKRFEGVIRVGNARYVVEQGTLSPPESAARPWILTSSVRERWLSTARDHTMFHFSDRARIHVGIKTTADNVFIRDDWEQLPPEVCPEGELLHPLLTHQLAARWRPISLLKMKRVLYPHVVVNGRKGVIKLEDFPKAEAYLELHRQQLAGRKYVLDARRNWFEIWVPQDPRKWEVAKIVFPVTCPPFLVQS